MPRRGFTVEVQVPLQSLQVRTTGGVGRILCKVGSCQPPHGGGFSLSHKALGDAHDHVIIHLRHWLNSTQFTSIEALLSKPSMGLLLLETREQVQRQCHSRAASHKLRQVCHKQRSGQSAFLSAGQLGDEACLWSPGACCAACVTSFQCTGKPVWTAQQHQRMPRFSSSAWLCLGCTNGAVHTRDSLPPTAAGDMPHGADQWRG